MEVKLYIKTHNKTGLKYFGKTTQAVNKYRGSGKYWKRHTKKHGHDVTTKVYGTYLEGDPNLKKDAIMFSIQNDIVKSEEWANLEIEDGHSGGIVGSIPWNKGKTGMYSDETLIEMSKRAKIRSNTPESKAAVSRVHKGKKLKQKQIDVLIANNTGRKHTVEAKSKIGSANRGEKNGMYGKGLVGEKNGMYGKTQTKESNISRSKALKGKRLGINSSQARPIFAENIYFPFMGMACDYLGISRSVLHNRLCNQKYKNYCLV